MVSKLVHSAWTGTVICFLVLLATLSAARAGVISTVESATMGSCLCWDYDWGQSFTAEDSFVSLEVEVGDANQQLAPDPWYVTLQFLEGAGPNGPVLDSFDFLAQVPGSNSRLFAFDLSHIALSVGAQYSFMLTNHGGRGYVRGHSGLVDVYTGGEAFTSTGARGHFSDLSFLVTPLATPVPSPGALALLSLGLFGLAVRPRTARRGHGTRFVAEG